MTLKEIKWFLNITESEIKKLSQSLQEKLSKEKDFFKLHLLGYSVFEELQKET